MAENPDIIKVNLSDGRTVEVEHLDWDGYKKIRPRLSDKLKESMAGFDAEALDGNAVIAPIITLLDSVVGEFTEEFVTACVRDKKSLKGITKPMDWLKLREAAANVNNIAEVLEMEGNAIAASVRIVLTRFNALAANDGGQVSNTP